MPLPDAYRWSDSPDGSSHLYWNYGFVASIGPDGWTTIKLWDKRKICSKAASVAQAKRFIERWILAQGSERARECARWRARYARPATALKSKKADAASRLLRQQARTEGGGASSRVIKVSNILPDDYHSISDVGEPLQAFTPHADYSRVRRRRMLVIPSAG